jgi:hypothetical protein
MHVNLHPGFPRLGPEFRWLSVRNDGTWIKFLLGKGFDVAYRGRYLSITRRGTISLAGISEIFQFRANKSLR